MGVTYQRQENPTPKGHAMFINTFTHGYSSLSSKKQSINVAVCMITVAENTSKENIRKPAGDVRHEKKDFVEIAGKLSCVSGI